MTAAAQNPPSSTSSAASPVEAEVMRIQGLIQTQQFAAALAAGQRLLAAVPENRDLLYLIAVSQRYLGQIGPALDTLARFEKIYPRFSRLFQERGHCYVAAHNPSAAIEAYLTAVNINVALPASWNALQVLFRSAGRTAEAEMAAAHVAKLANLPPEIVSARGLFADGDILLAEQIIRRFLQTYGDHIEAMRLLAQIGMKFDVLDDAEILLEHVLILASDYHLARYDYVQVLLQRHRVVKALEEAQKLIQADPRNLDFRAVYATACIAVGQYEKGIAGYRELLRETPQAAGIHLSMAHALKTLGRQQEAIDAYRSAAAAVPSYGDAYWSLANLKTYRFLDDEIEQMRDQESLPSTTLVDRYHLCFALGKALEDQADYAAAYGYYERGNALKKSEVRYAPEPLERNARRQMAICTREFFTTRKDYGCPHPDPIFIVGLPRSGSTLLEQILASHSRVEGTRELQEIPRLVHAIEGRNPDESTPAYTAALKGLTAEQCAKHGEKYLADTRIYRTSKPFFIDKMPNNFRHIALIQLILPNAKIIDARREPMACCFSNFKQLFATGQEFTYGIEDIARYYRMYLELMDHWNAALPGKILKIQHEEIVEDLEGNVRRLLDFCGLDFEPACLEFHKTERSIRTASSEQVRRPINKEGFDQWRHFEPWLGPLRSALGDMVPGTAPSHQATAANPAATAV
jgi:tetratricopeptide (TPR) repeat protein